jgi:hypothetical protein
LAIKWNEGVNYALAIETAPAAENTPINPTSPIEAPLAEAAAIALVEQTLGQLGTEKTAKIKAINQAIRDAVRPKSAFKAKMRNLCPAEMILLTYPILYIIFPFEPIPPR